MSAEMKIEGVIAETSDEDKSIGLVTIVNRDCNASDKKRVRRKVHLAVLPLLFVGLLVFQLDRTNIASALTGGFAVDIKVGQATINLGHQLMFMSIVVLGIPSNILLQRIGPRKWIASQVNE